MKGKWWFLFCIAIVATDLFCVAYSLDAARQILGDYQNYMSRGEDSLSKLKTRVLDTTKTEYQGGVSRSFDEFVRLTVEGDQRMLEALKYSQRVQNIFSILTASLNLVLLYFLYFQSRKHVALRARKSGLRDGPEGVGS